MSSLYDQYVGKFIKAILKSGDKRFGYLESVDNDNTLILKKLGGEGYVLLSIESIESCEIEDPRES